MKSPSHFTKGSSDLRRVSLKIKFDKFLAAVSIAAGWQWFHNQISVLTLMGKKYCMKTGIGVMDALSVDQLIKELTYCVFLFNLETN